MEEGKIHGNCVFHYENEATAKCAECNLTICKEDQQFNLEQDRICPICANRTSAKTILKRINYGLYGVVIIASILILVVFKLDFIYLFLPLILLFVAPYILRPYVLKFYFKDLKPNEVILPLLKYYEISSNQEYYKLFMNKLREIHRAELEEMSDVIIKNLIPAIGFNFSDLPKNWEEDIIEILGLTKKEFAQIITTKYKSVIVQTAVHAAQANISKFMFYLGDITGDDEFLKEYVREITSPEILELDDTELNSIYKGLLEELFLYEEDFLSLCDRLNLEEEKKAIAQLVNRFDVPPVPRSQIEAVLPPEQLRAKREAEEAGEKPELEKKEENETHEIDFEDEE